MRYVFCIAVCCVIVPINGQTTREHPNAYQKSASNAQPPKNQPSSPCTVNVDTVNVNKLSIAQQTDSARKADKDKNNPPSYLRRLVAPETLPNLILCILGIGGIIAAICTLKVIREQTVAIRKSVELQEIPFRQWVDFKNWKTAPRNLPGDGVVLDIQFDIVNPTKMPLMFSQIDLAIGRESVEHKETLMLLPEVPRSIPFSISLTSDQLKDWINSILKLTITGCVHYSDRLGTYIEKPFTGILACNQSWAAFEYRGLPSERTERGP